MTCGGCSWWWRWLLVVVSLYLLWFFFLSSLFLSQLFLVGLNWWLLGLKWWVVSVVVRFGLVMVGFGGGHLGVGWISRWRSGYGSRWRLGLIGFLGLSWCFGGDLLRWVAVAALGGAGFVFRWCCCGNVGFVVVALWRRWVCCGGIVIVCNSNTQQLWTNKTTQKPMGPTESENLPLCHWVMYLRN